jgi:hypothetical protein
VQISLIVRTEQGMMTMPIVLYDPEEMLAPMSQLLQEHILIQLQMMSTVILSHPTVATSTTTICSRRCFTVTPSSIAAFL